MKETIENLKKVLYGAVEKNLYCGLLFSGGLDTSILAAIKPEVLSITVSLGSKAEDIQYSKSLAKYLNLKHQHRKVDIDEAIEAIPEVIKVLKSFDPAIPNDLVVYFGLKLAKELGIKRVATGDGSDELFGGYSFMKDIEDLESYIQRIAEKMNFSSNDLGNFFGIAVIQPFIAQEVIDFSLKIPTDLKIKNENGKFWGKWILRKAFEDVLPKRAIWQNKRPLEYGSGMNRLRRIISNKISDDEFKEISSSIKFLNKEHFYYYKIYKEKVGRIPKPKSSQIGCPGCGAGINKDSFHCKTCGYILNKFWLGKRG